VLDGAEAVARPLRLLAALTPESPPTISWSRVSAPVLVVGRGAAANVINAAQCTAHNVPVVHRGSGGGPVLWDADLVSLDVVLPADHPLVGHDVTAAYAWIGGAVADALTRLGAPVRSLVLDATRALQRDPDPVRALASRACFGGISPFEVVGADGRKCVGLAQVRRAQGTLFQCGILLGANTGLLATLLGSDDQETAALAAAFDTTMCGLDAWGSTLQPDAVIAAVEQAVTDRTGAVIGD